MAIGLNNLFSISFSLLTDDGQTRVSDFIDNDGLVSFVTSEQCGGNLPTYDLSFKTSDSRILSMLNDTHTLLVKFGLEKETIFECLYISKEKESTKVGTGQELIKTSGILNKLRFISNPKQRIFKQKTSLQVVNLVLGTNFNEDDIIIETDVETNDLMNWIQPNQTDYKFIQDTLIHSNSLNSSLIHGITIDGKFIIKDLIKAIKEEPKWKFVPQLIDQEDIVYNPTYSLFDYSGIINSWVGYGQERMLYNANDGTSEKISYDPEPILSLTDKLPRNSSIDRYMANSIVNTSNTHDKYWQSQMKNLTRLGILSNIELRLNFTDRFNNIRLLDLVLFKDLSVDNTNNIVSNDYNSGLYFVTRVTRTIENNRIGTSVSLSRESFNNISGDSRQSVVVDETDPEELASLFSDSFSIFSDE